MALTFIHGFLGAPSDWDEVISHLDVPCKAIGLDDPITEPTILVGYSMGGRLALHHAKKTPHLVQKVIAISTNPGLKDKRERLQWDEAWIELLDREGLNVFLEKWYAQPIFATLDVNKVLPARKKLSMQTIKDHMRRYSIARQPSLWNELETFPVPVEFLFGTLDTKYAAIAHRLPCSVTFIEGAAHALHLEDPQTCAAKLQSMFL